MVISGIPVTIPCLFQSYGDIELALLCNGNIHSSDDWNNVLEPIIVRYQNENLIHYFRGDAVFANPDIYRLLKTEEYFYVIRLKGNNILQDHIEHLLTRPVGHLPKNPIVQHHGFQYQAASKKKSSSVGVEVSVS